MATDLFANHPPAGFTLEQCEAEIAALQDRLSYIEHDLIHGCPQHKYHLQAERYNINKRLSELQGWLDKGLV